MVQAGTLGEGDKFRLRESDEVWTVTRNFENWITAERRYGFLNLGRKIKSVHYQTWVYKE